MNVFAQVSAAAAASGSRTAPASASLPFVRASVTSASAASSSAFGQDGIDPLRVVQREAGATLARVGRELRARRLRRPEQRLHGGVVLGVREAAHAGRQQRRAARRDECTCRSSTCRRKRSPQPPQWILAGVWCRRTRRRTTSGPRTGSRTRPRCTPSRRDRGLSNRRSRSALHAGRRNAGAVRALSSAQTDSSTAHALFPAHLAARRTPSCRRRSAWRRRRRRLPPQASRPGAA